jgi:hypothetical protein
MSNRTIKVGITFEFYPDTEHEELFGEEKTLDEIIAHAKAMTSEDIDRLVKYNEVWDALRVEVVEEDE